MTERGTTQTRIKRNHPSHTTTRNDVVAKPEEIGPSGNALREKECGFEGRESVEEEPMHLSR
jgi:hypothetical protein